MGYEIGLRQTEEDQIIPVGVKGYGTMYQFIERPSQGFTVNHK